MNKSVYHCTSLHNFIDILNAIIINALFHYPGSLAAYRGMSSLASKMAIARNSLLNELVEESKKLPVIETQAQLATAQSGSRKLLRRATLGMLKKGSNIHPT
jgi:DNA-binding phage protein